MNEAQEFKRILFGLSQDGVDKEAGRFVSKFARLLDANLFGLFVQDMSRQRLSKLPFVRELRLLERNWADIDPKRLAEEVELAALRASREFAESAAAQRLSPRIEVVKGDPVRMLAEAVRAGDIVVLPQDRLIRSLMDRTEELAEAAFSVRASVMLVPHRAVAGHGPVLALARGSEEPSVRAARVIAAMAKRGLQLALPEYDSRSPLNVGRTFTNGPKELIIVGSRGIISHREAAEIAARRRTPVLIASEP